MPRVRRRQSRSRTRSRSDTLETSRPPKRRRIEIFDEGLSSEYSDETEEPQVTHVDEQKMALEEKPKMADEKEPKMASEKEPKMADEEELEMTDEEECPKLEISQESTSMDDSKTEIDSSLLKSTESESDAALKIEAKQLAKVAQTEITPKKALSPKQLQKRLESEKKREEKQKERDRIKQEKEQERKRLQEEKDKDKREKLEKKQKELEQKQKELEEKTKEKELKEEAKKREREEKELKRREKEEKIEQKRKELEEKNKEKLKQEEKKQKVAAAFANFFTIKKSENAEKESESVSISKFMPFELKSDMRLAPIIRTSLSDTQKDTLASNIISQDVGKTYLEEIKLGKPLGKSSKTWVDDDDDIVLIENDVGESILDQTKTPSKMKAKFLKFEENRRPPYFGTWKKKSKVVKPRAPFSKDSEYFDYDVDSDDDWEEEDPAGESLAGSEDEDKENESENEYDEDNEFLVPHGHLSDDEVNDEECAVINPEDHKAKLKLLKKEFEDEMNEKTQRIKPRVIGCVWYNKDGDNVDEVIREYFKPLSIIANGPIVIKKREDIKMQTPMRNNSHIANPLSEELIPEFLKFIHGSTNNYKTLIKDFLKYLSEKEIATDASKTSLHKQLRKFAEWTRCQEEGSMLNKFCWCVRSEVKEEFKIHLTL